MDDLNKDAEINTLAVRRQCHARNIVFRGLDNTSTPGINSTFTYIGDDHQCNTKSSSNLMLKVARYKLQISKGNFHIRGACYYNDVPIDVKQALSIESPKR